MSLFTLDLEKITNAKTKEYFREVVSSYNNGNYRSSVVVLYSVCVCDIIFKLKDLAELYSDERAEKILKEYRNNFKTGDKPASKSEWEKKLIEEACTKGLIDTVTKERLANLYSARNMAAHPILEQNYELYNPTKEEAVALILTMYNSLLTQPSLFMSSIVDMLSEDLAKNKSILGVDQKQFEIYLRSKYFEHLNKKYLQEVFKAFWRFCFVLENDECNANRNINLQMLRYIIRNNEEDCIEAIQHAPDRFGCSLDPSCLRALVEFLAEFPDIYKKLGAVVRTNIESFIERDERKVISWFLFDSPENFVDGLKRKWNVHILKHEYRDWFQSYFEDNGRLPLMYDFYVYLFCSSRSFDDSCESWYWLLKDRIGSLSIKQLEDIVQAINTNEQIYSNVFIGVPEICELIAKEFADRKIEFDFTKYPKFLISKDYNPKVVLARNWSRSPNFIHYNKIAEPTASLEHPGIERDKISISG